jgi:hypothetical protein
MEKLGTLNDAAVRHVQTRYDAFCKHGRYRVELPGT